MAFDRAAPKGSLSNPVARDPWNDPPVPHVMPLGHDPLPPEYSGAPVPAPAVEPPAAPAAERYAPQPPATQPRHPASQQWLPKR